jgi:lipopolysaccharide export system protein LptC
MARAAAVDETERRRRLHASLERRNGLVAALRIFVPVIGAASAVVVVGGLVLDGMSNRFGFANVRIDRDNLVVDTPHLSSTLADGTSVTLTAASAKLAVNDTDLAELTKVAFTADLANGTALRADADLARLTISTQVIRVPGTTRVVANTGFVGNALDVVADVQGLRLEARGPVDLNFGPGNRLVASDMLYDHNTGTFVFHHATMSLTSTPGDEQ